MAIESDNYLNTRNIIEPIRINISDIYKHLESSEYIKEIDFWIHSGRLSENPNFIEARIDLAKQIVKVRKILVFLTENTEELSLAIIRCRNVIEREAKKDKSLLKKYQDYQYRIKVKKNESID